MRIWRYFGTFLLWNVAMGLPILLLPAPWGAVAAVAISIAVAWVYLFRDTRAARRRRALARLRPLRGESLRWTLAAVPAFLLLSWSLGEVYMQLVRVSPESLNPLGDLFAGPLGTLSLALLAVGIAPVMEEIFFRGLIQRRLELRWGPLGGILGAAALFGIVHLLPMVFPLHLFLGTLFGFSVWATRSIWAGVMLHAANNAVAVAGLVAAGRDPDPTPTLWEIGPTADWWIALTLLVLSGFLAGWTARRLWWAGRGMRTFAGRHPLPGAS